MTALIPGYHAFRYYGPPATQKCLGGTVGLESEHIKTVLQWCGIPLGRPAEVFNYIYHQIRDSLYHTGMIRIRVPPLGILREGDGRGH